MTFISENYSIISKYIKVFERQGLSIVESINLFEEINLTSGTLADKIKNKLFSIENQNKGFLLIKKISQILNGGDSQLDGDISLLSPSDIKCLKFAPLTSCDVERSFSTYKMILSDKRHSLGEQNLKHMCIIQCNQN